MAFTGFKGYGSATTGGYKTGAATPTIHVVTNGNNSGTGSFRAAAEASGLRIIIFRVRTINLTSAVTIGSGNVTIAGQTAGGVQILGSKINFQANNIICQGLKFRGASTGTRDNLLIGASGVPVTKLVIDHCSSEFGHDENFDLYRSLDEVTISNNIMAWGLHNEVDVAFDDGYGLLMAGINAEHALHVTICNNLFAFNWNRNPRVTVCENLELVNNYIYSPGDLYRTTDLGSDGSPAQSTAVMNVSVRNNVYRMGTSTDEVHATSTNKPIRIGHFVGNGRFYVNGNLAYLKNGSAIANPLHYDRGSSGVFLGSPEIANFTPLAASAVQASVLANAGAYPQDRDPLDQELIDRVTAMTGSIIDSPNDVGGIPTLSPPTITDTDGDGIPDDMEASYGPGAHTVVNGYTQLQHYHNDLLTGGTPIVGTPPVYDGLAADLILTKDSAMTPADLSVNFTGADTYASADLPTGLSVHSTTGIISGTPTVFQAVTPATVTATNEDGDTPATFDITVEEPAAPPVYDGLAADLILTVGQVMASVPMAQHFTGADSYSASDLPAGIAIASDTGIISGTPSATQAATEATVTGTNVDGDTDAVFDMTVAAAAAPEIGGSIRLTVDGFVHLSSSGAVSVVFSEETLSAPVNTVAPLITDRPWPDMTLTCSTGTWDNADTYAFQWKGDGVDIGGATSNTFVPTAGMVGDVITCVVTATGPGGSESEPSSNSATVEAEPSDFDDLQAAVTSLAYRGVTINLSASLPYFWSANGDPVFITTQASSVTSFSPASATDANGLVHSGAMVNPEENRDGIGVSQGRAQGFDAAIGTRPANRFEYIPYLTALNKDPAISGALAIAQGSSFSLVKCVREVNWNYPDGWKSVEKYVVFTFMSAVPTDAGLFFRPPVSTTTKTYPAKRFEDMDFTTSASPLRHLPKPTNMNGPSTQLANIATGRLETLPIWYGTTHGRRVQPSREVNAGSTGYAKDHGKPRGEIACSLFITQTGTEQTARETLAKKIIQWGIDCDGANQSGNKHGAGAGQWHGYIEFYYIAAFLLGDAAMLARAKTHRSNALNQQFWVTEDVIGYPVGWDTNTDGSGARRSNETYFPTELGKPDWNKEGSDSDNPAFTSITQISAGDIEDLNSSLGGNYRDIYGTNAIVEVLPIALLRNGPSGETGIEAIDSIGSGEMATAVLPWVDRSMSLYSVRENLVHYWHNSASQNAYNAWRDEVRDSSGVAVPRWTGVPDIWASHQTPNFRTGTSGAIDWSLTDYTKSETFDFATETVTKRELEFSQDNVQFLKRTDIGTTTTSTKTGLRPGTPHWCRWRQTSASGAGPWSPTWFQRHPNQTAVANNFMEADRHKLSSGGAAPGGTFANDVAPAIYYMQCPEHQTPRFEPAPAILADAVVYGPSTTEVEELIAGIGYWTGGATTPSITWNSDYTVPTITGWTVTYQWQRNGANISGATGQRYTLQVADAGQGIRCRVTVNSVTVSSNVVTA